MARLFFSPILILFAISCAGLQTVQEESPAGPMPAVRSHALPSTPVASLEEIQKEPLTVAYSMDFPGIDDSNIRRILEQKFHGWLRAINIRGTALQTFRIGPDESAPSGYPYVLRLKVDAEEDHYVLEGLLEHATSGRSYPAFHRNFEIEKPSGEGDGLALFSGLTSFLSDGTAPSISFPATTGAELKEWISRIGTGQVRILSGPEASIQIMDRSGGLTHSGTTPLEIDLPAGAYEFRIKRKGMEQRVQTTILRPASQEVLLLTWPDDESAGSLSVITSPEQLQVAIDGTVQGRSPVALPSLVPGGVEVEIANREEDSGEAFVLRSSTVVVGEGQDISRFFPFSYYIDFARQPAPGNMWHSNQALTRIKRAAGGLELGTVQKTGDLPPGLLSQPLEAMDLKMRISFQPGANLILGLASGEGSDRPMLQIQSNRVYFHAPESSAEKGSGAFVRPAPGEGQLEVLEIRYYEESRELSLSLNGKEIYDGPYQNSGYFRLFLSGTGNTVPVEEVDVRAGPMVSNPFFEWAGSFFFDLGRSLGMNGRLRPLPQEK
ncbi:MAG: hypothetical protein KDK25_01030 [Leptospiraceae bacterium]|nr:hypothetical protein [Leptospiraceae bacterium]